MSTADIFLKDFKENEDLNQYWYSNFTIQKMVDESTNLYNKYGGSSNNFRIGCLSTPSIYFSFNDEIRKNSYVFDYDKQWESDRGFVFYDFNKPEDVPDNLRNSFDLLIIDPPFITEEVWRKYAETAKLLLKTGKEDDGEQKGKVICTTIYENEKLINELFGTLTTPFLPSIPNLVYQYNLYVNFKPDALNIKNPEIPE